MSTLVEGCSPPRSAHRIAPQCAGIWQAQPRAWIFVFMKTLEEAKDALCILGFKPDSVIGQTAKTQLSPSSLAEMWTWGHTSFF